MEINQITDRVLGCAFKVHSALGPDFSKARMKNVFIMN